MSQKITQRETMTKLKLSDEELEMRLGHFKHNKRKGNIESMKNIINYYEIKIKSILEKKKRK